MYVPLFLAGVDLNSFHPHLPILIGVFENSPEKIK